MIKIKNLSFSYPGTPKPILQNINLEIEAGDFLAIAGNNGCGKSTLCKTLNGLIPHFFAGDFTGKVEIGHMDTAKHSVGELAFQVGYVYQDFENQIVRPTVLDDASFACLNYAMEDYLEKGRRALFMTGLSNKEKDYVWQLSGGQKHLLALAGTAALSPDILILDEPVAQLDPLHARQIYDVLKDLNETYGKTIIVIEHHTEFIAEYCRHLVLMKEGKILWKLPAKEGLNRVEELLANNIFPPQITMAARCLMKRSGKEEDTFFPVTLAEGRRYFTGLVYHKMSQEKTKRGKNGSLIRIKNAGVEYRAVKGSGLKILDNFSLDIRGGEKIALIGNNGAGKSTVLKLITGLLKPRQGTVEVGGISTRDILAEDMAHNISLVYQNPEEMFVKDSIRADIEYAMKARKMENYKERTDNLLQMFCLEEYAHRDGRLLSGGQMRRASLAIGIALNPRILLLDEPTANLDIATRKEIIRTLDAMKEAVETTVIATHDMQLVSEWADRIIVLCNGRIIADGSKEEIFGNQHVIRSAGIEPPEIYSMGRELNQEARCFTVEEFIASFASQEDKADRRTGNTCHELNTIPAEGSLA